MVTERSDKNIEYKTEDGKVRERVTDRCGKSYTVIKRSERQIDGDRVR